MNHRQKVEDVLTSLNGAERAVPRPFLFTRIMARINDEAPDSVWAKAIGFFTKPVVLAAIFLIMLAANYSSGVRNNDRDVATETMASTNIYADYSLNDGSYYMADNE